MDGKIKRSMSSNFECGYCGKTFTKEKTLAVHVCEKKRRHNSRNEKHVQSALLAYQKFYEHVQRSSKPKTFDEFVSSPYYNAFVKFGSFVVSKFQNFVESLNSCNMSNSGTNLQQQSHFLTIPCFAKSSIQLISRITNNKKINKSSHFFFA